MPKPKGAAFINAIITLVFFAAIPAFIFLKLPFEIPFLLLFSGVIFLVAFVNSEFALGILVFSMLLSPELKIFNVPDRSVVVRIDDLLLLVIFFSWLARLTVSKGFGFLKNTALNKPLFVYALLCVVVTAAAILLGAGQAKFSSAFFYILKYLEYFLLFILVVNNIKDTRQVRVLIFMMLFVCFIVCLYGYWQLFTAGAERLSAPFEGEKPEPNTLAGYLVLMLSLIGGLLLYSRTLTEKLTLGGLFLFAVPVFLFTLSREGYLAFFAMYFSFAVFSRKARFLLLVLFIASALFLPRILPLSVIERVKVTFSPDRTVGAQRYKFAGKRFAVEESAAARFEALRWLIPLWKKSPFFGYGVTGVGFVDGQYMRILGELGIAGLISFFWIILRLFRSFLNVYRNSEDRWIKGVSLGLLSSLAAMLVQNAGANVFIIVRIMEPFWFLAAMVLAVPLVKEEFITEDIG
jgi:hypothetical protein